MSLKAIIIALLASLGIVAAGFAMDPGLHQSRLKMASKTVTFSSP
jgi:hypothetical protein